MLENAFLWEEQLRLKLYETWYDDKYKFYTYNCWNSEFALPHEEGDWNRKYFVSLDSDRNVIGLIHYEVMRSADHVDNLGAICFAPRPSVTFMRDLCQVIDDIFVKFNHLKLNYQCVVGNPAMRMWEDFATKCGTERLCTFKQHTKLVDNRLYDVAQFEILADDYLKNRSKFLRKEMITC